MPKAKGKGGKNRRRGKNDEDLNKRELIFKEDGQEYAQVVKMLGNGRLEAKCQDGETRLGQIRGQMRKKIWIVGGDIILLSLREFQDGIADVIHKYTADEARNLKTYGELKADFQVNDADAGGEGSSDEEGGIEFEEAEIDDICRMTSFHPLPLNLPPSGPLQNPTEPKPSPDGSSLKLHTGEGTNYWRVPFPALGSLVPMRLSPTEWVKTGAEFNLGKQWHGVVVCNSFSDWSIQTTSDANLKRLTISFDPTSTTLRVYLGPATSSPFVPMGGDGDQDDTAGDIMIRQVSTFELASAGLAHLVPGQVPPNADPAAKLAGMEMTVGLMACSPMGEGRGPECVLGGLRCGRGCGMRRSFWVE